MAKFRTHAHAQSAEAFQAKWLNEGSRKVMFICGLYAYES